MKALLIKDWKLLKNQGGYFSTVFLIVIMIMCIGSADTAGFIISYMTFFFFFFVLSTLSYDSYDNGMAFLMSFPVDRKTYIAEKYIFAIFLSLGSWLASILLRLVFFFIFQTPEGDVTEFIYSSPMFLMMALIFLGYSLPIHLKYGSEKGNILSFGILGAACFGTFLFLRITDSTELIRLFQNITDKDFGSLMAGMAGFCIIFWGISYGISLRIMVKKEF